MSQKCVIKFHFLGRRFDEEYLVVSDICQLNCELSNIIINLRTIRWALTKSRAYKQVREILFRDVKESPIEEVKLWLSNF